MNRYLLPCSCAHRIVVGPGQAGGEVACPACGARVAVPRLGTLARLEAVDAAAGGAAGRNWSRAQAWLLAGIAVTIAGLAAAGWLRGRRAGFTRVDEGAITAVVETAPVDQVYVAWLRFEQDGIQQEPLPDERRRQDHAAALGALETCAWIGAAVGAALAIGAAIPAIRCRPPRGGPPA